MLANCANHVLHMSYGVQPPLTTWASVFKFTLQGITRPSSMQAVNEGGDVASGNIDVMMDSEGEGAYLGCTVPDYQADPMFGPHSYPGFFGQTALKSGPATKGQCANLPALAAALDQSSPASGAVSLVDLCEASSDLNLRPMDSTTDDNPLITCTCNMSDVPSTTFDAGKTSACSTPGYFKYF